VSVEDGNATGITGITVGPIKEWAGLILGLGIPGRGNPGPSAYAANCPRSTKPYNRTSDQITLDEVAGQ
jgi:hypothetical protein